MSYVPTAKKKKTEYKRLTRASNWTICTMRRLTSCSCVRVRVCVQFYVHLQFSFTAVVGTQLAIHPLAINRFNGLSPIYILIHWRPSISIFAHLLLSYEPTIVRKAEHLRDHKRPCNRKSIAIEIDLVISLTSFLGRLMKSEREIRYLIPIYRLIKCNQLMNLRVISVDWRLENKCETHNTHNNNYYLIIYTLIHRLLSVDEHIRE